MRMKGTTVTATTAQVLSFSVQIMCLHPGSAFPGLGSVMVMRIVRMAMMSIRIAPGDRALEMISPVVMDCVFHTHTGVTGAMTVGITATRGTAPTPPAARTSSPVRTGCAFMSSICVMGKTTVEMGLTSWSTCATLQRPRAPLISSSVTMGTALIW